MVHKSVLLQEVIDFLSPQKGELLVDCTINGGGHSRALSEKVSGDLNILGIDADSKALERAEQNLSKHCKKLFLFKGNFRKIDEALSENNLKDPDMILFDFGLSSNQLDEGGRGFSFRFDEPLLMTLNDNPKDELTAMDVVNSFEEENLANAIYEFGEERLSKRIAKAIVLERKKELIKNTKRLHEIIQSVVPRRGKIDPATKTFQALRIIVNDELGAISEALPKAWNALKKGGRMATISFHSLEDRIAKNFFKEISRNGEGELLSKKVIVPQRKELLENPRSRSAKMRIAIKL